MSVSHSLNRLLASVYGAHQNDTKTIEPLDLLAGIVENRESKLASTASAMANERRSISVNAWRPQQFRPDAKPPGGIGLRRAGILAA
jgi:hypothetical protein